LIMHLPKGLQDGLLPLLPAAETAVVFSKTFSYKVVYLYEENGAPIFDGKKQAAITQRLIDGAIMRPNGKWLKREEFSTTPESVLIREFPFLVNKKIQLF